MTGPDDIVGFIGRPEGLRISLPPCYPENLRNAPNLDDSLQLFRILRKYRQLIRGRNAVKAHAGIRREIGSANTDGRDLSVIEAGLGLAEDYRRHGLLRFREMRINDGPVGRINWARTLQRAIPTPTRNSVIYAQPQRRHLASRNDHAITQLHAATIRDVFSRFFGGWVDLEVEQFNNDSVAKQLGTVLSRYRGLLYQERQLSILRMIEAYWGQNPKGARSVETTWEYTEKFEAIWETMCRSVMRGGAADAGGWPSGRYVGESGQDFGAGLRLVPDFVRSIDGYVIVFDAKFYTSDGLPDTYSILKQLAYGFFLSNEWHHGGAAADRIIHVFLFPKLSNPGGHATTVRGRHTISPAGQSPSMAAPIFLVDLDYRAVTSAFLRHTEIEVSEIVRLITADRPLSTAAS